MVKLAGVDTGLDSGHSLGVILWDTCKCNRFFWRGDNGVNIPSDNVFICDL